VFERPISTKAFRSAVCPVQILDRWYMTLHTTTCFRSHYSSVVTMFTLGYELEGEIVVRKKGNNNRFSLLRIVHSDSGLPTQAPIHWVLRFILRNHSDQMRDTGLSTSSGSAVKNVWNCTSNLPFVLLVWGITEHKNNLTSTFNTGWYYTCVTTDRIQSIHYIQKIVKIPPFSNDYEEAMFYSSADRHLSIRRETWVRIPGSSSYFIVITIFS